jgi:hypothetical protein
MRRLFGGLFLASQSSVAGCAAVDGRFECLREVQKAINQGAASAGRKSLALAPTATDALVLVSQRQSLPDW